MECGKLTAKLRDAVPVCFMDGGMEVKRYKNIEIPDEIKKLPFDGFKFDVPAKGAITFKIYFAPGILPKEWPQARERKARTPKAAMSQPEGEEAAQAAPVEEAEETPEEVMTEAAPTEPEILEEAAMPVIPEDMEQPYNVTGDRRKALVQAISDKLGKAAKYQNAPSFAYVIGDYVVDKNGTLIGPQNAELLAALAAQGFEE